MAKGAKWIDAFDDPIIEGDVVVVRASSDGAVIAIRAKKEVYSAYIHRAMQALHADELREQIAEDEAAIVPFRKPG